MEKKKILITVGGTGGHIYPALALATELKSDCEVCFVGGNLKNNPFFSRHGFPYHTISCGTFGGKNPLHYLKSTARIALGVGQSICLMKRFQPSLLVGFGSYYTFPVLLAAKAMRVPLVLHEANSIPGKVNRLMAPFATLTGVHFPETKDLLKGKTAVVGMPVRTDFHPSKEKRELALSYYGLQPDKQTLLIFGGSQGAHTLNALFREAASRLKGVQILHMTGNSELTKICQAHYQKLGLKAVVKDFEARMDLAWSVANLVISRAGASTIAEQLAFSVPALFIPYPFATDNHQEKNADFVVNTVKGGMKVREKGLSADALAEAIIQLQENLPKMQQALKLYQQKRAGEDLATHIRELI